MVILVDIELSFSMEEMKLITKASELNKQTPEEYVKRVITNAYTKDLAKKSRVKSKAIKRVN